jgi:AcrR family transcriptional regulator
VPAGYAPEVQPLRRRSGLLQERSRRTRQQLVSAALALWSERGFEKGIEETTVEEIVDAVGATKGTFYFHFARKEEILLEMGWDTAEKVNDEAERCLAAGRGLDDSLARLMGVLARHVEAAPRSAVGRAVAEFYRRPSALAAPAAGGPSPGHTRPAFADSFRSLFVRALENGELPCSTDPFEMATMLQALVMDSILDWSAGQADLLPVLRRRARLLTAGLRAQTAQKRARA